MCVVVGVLVMLIGYECFFLSSHEGALVIVLTTVDKDDRIKKRKKKRKCQQSLGELSL